MQIRARLHSCLFAFLCFPVVCALVLPAGAQPAPATIAAPKARPEAPAAAPAPASPVTAHPLEKADLEAFFDGIIPLQLQRSDLSGAVVYVRQGDQVLLEKGYGFADVKKKSAVDPRTTMFRLASISKTFTWVSVMQLEEQGKVNLDADVNDYLDFKIAPAFGKPVTLRNLMTHTGGFEETIRDIIVTDPKKAPALRDYIIANQPKRMYPPGTITAYSNYGVGLAGYIVQRVSGQPFEQYVNDHIFKPLAMAHSSFTQPLVKELASSVSEGYRSADKAPVGFEIFNPAPAGGISSSAGDMARFAQMLLNGGSLDGAQILKPETVAQMWTRQFAASDQMPAMCMGFYQNWRNNLRWIGHEGDLIAFHSAFFMEPAQKLTLFVSFNSVGNDGKGAQLTRPELINAFSDRYFPADMTPRYQKLDEADRKTIPGTFQSTRRADSTRLAIVNLLAQAPVTINKDGELTSPARKTLRGAPEKWKPVGNDLWRQTGDGQDLIYLIRDGSGTVQRIAVDFPGVQLQRVVWYENGRLILFLVGASLLIFALAWIAILVRFGRRLFFRSRPSPAVPIRTRRLSFSLRAAAFWWIAVTIYTAAILAPLMDDDAVPPSHCFDTWLIGQNALVALAILCSIFAIVSGIRIWRRDLRPISKVKYSLVAAACAFMTWFAFHWNLIGPAHRF